MQIYVHIEQMRNGQFKNNIITVYCIVFYILSNGEHSHKSSQLQIFFKSRSFLQGKLKENCHYTQQRIVLTIIEAIAVPKFIRSIIDY